MSINLSDIQDSLYNWADSILSGDVIWANENAPDPGKPYYDLMINPITKIGGTDYESAPDDITLKTEIIGNREFTLQVRSFGSGTIQGLHSLIDSLEKGSVLDSLRAEGIAYVQPLTGILDITGLRDTRFEERGVLDLQFRVASVDEDDVPIIDNLNAELISKIDLNTITVDLITITA